MAYNLSVPVDRSGTITSGGTSQTLIAANGERRGFMVQNLSTGDLWVNVYGSPASAASPSFKVPAGAMYETPPHLTVTAAITVFGASTGQAYQAAEW